MFFYFFSLFFVDCLKDIAPQSFTAITSLSVLGPVSLYIIGARIGPILRAPESIPDLLYCQECCSISSAVS